MEIFRELADAGKCVILVSHSSEVANMCDERYELVKIVAKTKKCKPIKATQVTEKENQEEK